VIFMMRTAASHAVRSVLVVSLLSFALSGADEARAWWFPNRSAAAHSVALADLPSQGRETYRLIFQGGPFPHDKDGSVFGNRERQLPAQKRGYYHEYTVETPGSRDRGARRIVCGGRERTRPEACYYTSDHYSSFRKIVE